VGDAGPSTDRLGGIPLVPTPPAFVHHFLEFVMARVCDLQEGQLWQPARGTLLKVSSPEDKTFKVLLEMFDPPPHTIVRHYDEFDIASMVKPSRGLLKIYDTIYGANHT